MKKILTLTVLFAALLLTAISCGKDDPKPAPGKDDPKTPPADQKVEVTGVTLNKETLTLEIGAEGTLAATVDPTNATDKKVTWSSSDKTIATVDNNGKVTAVAVGEATITAKAGDKTASCEVTVAAQEIAVTGITLSINKSVFNSNATTTSVTATIQPSNATNKLVTWSIDATDVAQIISQTNSSCNIKALKNGYAILTATTQDGDKTATCFIAVNSDGQSAWTTGAQTFDMPLRYVQKGTFQMGSPSDTQTYSDEKPQHSVTLTKAFYMSKFEITNYQFAEFLNAKNVGSNGTYNGNKLIEAHERGVQYNTTTGKWQAAAGKEHYPVVYVTWYGATEFAKWLGGRLPTEAEWEYACRAGTTTPYYWGSTSTNIGNYAWYEDNSNSTTHPVGNKQPNGWGLYDMAGNVYEWCSDWYSSTYYSSSAQTDPTGPTSGTKRVCRGGSWGNGASICRSAYRDSGSPTNYSSNIGFRVVFNE